MVNVNSASFHGEGYVMQCGNNWMCACFMKRCQRCSELADQQQPALCLFSNLHLDDFLTAKFVPSKHISKRILSTAVTGLIHILR